MINQVLSVYTRTYALWVVIFGIAAYGFPAPFLAIALWMQWFFALTMFGIGVTLTVEDFRRIAKQPYIVAVGCVAQYTIMPLGALVAAKALRLPDEVTVGLILTGSAPGAMASNVMSYIARADVAYSVSLTTVSTLLAPLLTPGLTFVLASTTMDVPFWDLLINVLWTVVLPLLAGFGVRAMFHKQITPVLAFFPALSATFIIFICAVVIAGNRAYLAQLTALPLVFLACVGLNFYGMVMGYGTGKLFRMDHARRRTLTIEIGMQNAGLGTVLALEHFGAEAALPAAVFVFVCIVTASALPAVWQWRDRGRGEMKERNHE
jgi:BASS family bile acid:Na+ symporter